MAYYAKGRKALNTLLEELIKRAAKIGWTYKGVTHAGHTLFIHTTGAKYHSGSTPSDHRGLQNTISDMERIGGQREQKVNHKRSRKNPKKQDTRWLEASRRKQAKRLEQEELQKQKRIEDERRRIASIEAAKASDRREREIRRLMRGR